MVRIWLTQNNNITLRHTMTLCLFVAAMTACSKPKSEAEQYAELQDSFKYKTYQALSNNSLPAILKVASESNKTVQIDEDVAHLLLSYLWAVSNKPDFAIAESHLAEKTASADHMKFIAHSARAIGMHEKNWKSLAHQEAELGKQVFKNPEDQAKAANELTAMYFILGVASLYEKDLDRALTAFRGLETQTGFSVPAHLTQALLHIKQGQVKETKAELLLAANDPLLPTEIKNEILRFIAEFENEYGSMDSSLFLTRLISNSAWQAIKSSSKNGMQSLAKALDEFTQSVKNKIP